MSDLKELPCNHCGLLIGTRNPSGFCDHLYYPDNCDVCKNDFWPENRRRKQEERACHGLKDPEKEIEALVEAARHVDGCCHVECVSMQNLLSALEPFKEMK